jgi:RNase H-like protein
MPSRTVAAQLTGGAQVTVTCGDLVADVTAYLLDGIIKWIKGWQLNGWKTAARKPVKDDDLWRGLADAISRHDVTVGVGEGVTLAIRATSAPAHWHGIGEAATMVGSAPVISAGRA